MIKHIYGIDGGLNGGIAILNAFTGEVRGKFIMPTNDLPDGGREIHTDSLAAIFLTYPSEECLFVLEKIHAIFGASKGTMFTMAEGYGTIKGLLAGLNISYTLITPKAWQKIIWKPSEIVKKSSSSGKTQVNDTKAISLAALKRLYPHLDLRYADNEILPKNLRRTKFHDGLVDAILIAKSQI